ncbi:unnamed protein product [Lupinus luteus]|uniref:CW-type domain-containing protein n=1 Tax=Lupinus luteus TaxID=3873 RepID=A0AAV1XY61_LUPLU
MQHSNTEVEEGEACFFKHDENDYIDLDSLSYIDERIEHVLGHFQKDFEGGVSAEHLGAKFGGYGSFLPTYERSPSFRSHPKTPQKHYCSQKSTNLHTEVALHNSKAPSNVPPSRRLETDSRSTRAFHIKALSIDDSVKKDTGISSGGLMEKCTLKDDCANKSVNSTYQRTLKLRLKVKSDFLAKKKAAIYSGLGLDISPSSSLENSPEQSEGMLPVSQEIPEESPNDIFKVMTSFAIPGGVLISPLPDSLLHLIGKKVVGGNRPMSSCIGHQEHCSMATDESDSFVGDGHFLKKRKVRMAGQSEEQLELKRMSGNHSESDITLLMKKGLRNRTPDHMDFFPSDMKHTPLSSSFRDTGETAEVTGKTFELSKEVNKARVKYKTVSIKAVKGDSLESISGQDFDKIEKQNTGTTFMQKVLEHKLEISHNDNSTDLKNNNKYNAFMISEKAEHNAVKFEVDQHTLKRETDLKGKSKTDGKNKSKDDQSPVKCLSVAKKDIVVASNNAMVTDTKSPGFAITGKSNMHKTKSLKGNKVRDFDRDLLKGKKPEGKVNGIDLDDSPPGYKAVESSNLDNIEVQSVNAFKIKDKKFGNKIINQLIAGSCVKDASGTFPMTENEPAPEMVPAAAPEPEFIEEHWVGCDSCEKWRLIPMGLKPEHLPEKWSCSMLDWLPGMNRCNVSQDETTKAVHALYPMPMYEGQNKMQGHTTIPATGVSYDALQVGLNHKKSSSGVMPDQGKKKHGIKENAIKNDDMRQLLNTAKNNAQESGKNRNLTASYQQHADSNPMKKSSSKHLNRLNRDQMTGGDRDHIKLKGKVEATQYRSRIPKKSKAEDVCYADKEMNPGVDFKKVSLNSGNDLLMKSSRNYNEYYLSEDVQDKLVVPVKKGDQSQFSPNDVSFNVSNNSKKDGSIKKRNLKDWLECEKHNHTSSMQYDMQRGQEGLASGYRKEKKHSLLNTEAKSVPEGDDKLNIEGGVKHVFLSDSRDQMAVGTEWKSIDTAHQPRKKRKNVAPHQGLDCFDPLGKDLSTGQHSLAATSSSSNISENGFSKNSVRHFSSQTGKQTEPNQNNFASLVLNLNASHDTNMNSLSQKKQVQDLEEEKKANPVHSGSRDVKSKVPSSSESETRRATSVASRTATGSQKGDMPNRHPVPASGLAYVTKLVRTSADVSCKVGVNHSSGNFASDRQVTESSPITTNSSQTAFSILEEARKLKDTADQYKNSGFEFESNETYLKAALKFLHGASIVETCHSESNKHGEMSQMQIYATTAKLFESCANEYKKQQELAAAAVAYKCMEVVYMRMVYCKHSIVNRDLHELRSVLQVVSQGESPSSSVSDIDNLNNLVDVEKATLCTTTHIANNQVISAQSLPNIVRLLDFTKDINFAMEASRKCQSAFMAANVTMEETQNRDCIHIIRKVVDFSFQDVEELVNLVSNATKSLSCAGLGGA